MARLTECRIASRITPGRTPDVIPFNETAKVLRYVVKIATATCRGGRQLSGAWSQPARGSDKDLDPEAQGRLRLRR